MMQVHVEGRGCAGCTVPIVETKVETVHDLARQHGFLLRASTEPDKGFSGVIMFSESIEIDPARRLPGGHHPAAART